MATLPSLAARFPRSLRLMPSACHSTKSDDVADNDLIWWSGQRLRNCQERRKANVCLLCLPYWLECRWCPLCHYNPWTGK